MFKHMWTELRTMLKTVTPAQVVAHELQHAETGKNVKSIAKRAEREWYAIY